MKHHHTNAIAAPSPTPITFWQDHSLHPDGLVLGFLLVLVSLYKCGRSKILRRRPVKASQEPWTMHGRN